jgi:hypothetical protein
MHRRAGARSAPQRCSLSRGAIEVKHFTDLEPDANYQGSWLAVMLPLKIDVLHLICSGQ